MNALRFYTEQINDHMEIFMIPRLINNLEESTKSQVIWINDAVNISQYKHIDKVIFLGLHPLNRTPYLLNYAASEKNMELNFEITTVWGCLKDWIYREKIHLDNSAMNDKISGNYILQFNKDFELNYLNNYDRQEMEPFFVFPAKIRSQQELKLESILKHKILWESIHSIITSLVESGEKESEISKPNINIRVHLDEKGRLKGFVLIFRNSLMYNLRNSDPFADFEYAVTPLSVIKNEEIDNISLADNNHSVYSGRESVFSGIRRKTMADKKGNKKSMFGARREESPNRLASPVGLSPINTRKGGDDDQAKGNKRLQKQASRFTVEGSLFSEAPGSLHSVLGPQRRGQKAMRSRIANRGSGGLDDEDSSSKYRKIEERVNKSIVMEYMQPAGDRANISHSNSAKHSSEILPELEKDKDSGDKFVKHLLDIKKKSKLCY